MQKGQLVFADPFQDEDSHKTFRESTDYTEAMEISIYSLR